MKRMKGFFELRRDERGLALVSVLWALSVLSLIAAAMMSSGILSYRMERNDWQRLQAQALAEFAINRAILGLTDERVEKRWRVDGVAQDFSLGDARLRVRVQDETGKIDLNTADGDLLKRLFLSTGVPVDQADALANRIVDWRTPNDDKNPDSVKQTNIAPANAGYRPRNGPYQSVDELELMVGMTPALFARIAPAITIYSKGADINQQVAPREALLALPDMDEQKADAIISARTDPAGSPGQQANGTKLGLIDTAIPPNGRVFSITVEVLSARQRVMEEAVVELTGDSKRPYLILGWK
jgi:general secretion pathway protein K